MNRPKSVQVFGKTYTIEWDSEDLEEHVFGDISQKFLQVRVAPKVAGHEERETLLHELVHAVEHQLGINLPENKVRQLSVGLFAVLVTNPKLRSYLFGKPT